MVKETQAVSPTNVQNNQPAEIQQKANNSPKKKNNNNGNKNQQNNSVQAVAQPQPAQQTYAGAMMTPAPTQPQATTARPDMQFQNVPANNQQDNAVHNTNAPAGEIERIGVYFCRNHKVNGTRCKYCLGHGCEWKQIFDPTAIGNPNVRPLKSYGEVMLEREQQARQQQGGQQQQQGNNQQYGNNGNNGYNNNGQRRFNNNYNNRYQNQGQQQQPQQQGNEVSNVQYFQPPNGNNNANNNAAASGSGNAMGAPSLPTGCQ